MIEREEIHYGTTNVFADLGFPNPEEHLAKANLTIQIHDIIRQRKLTQKKVAALFGIDQPKVSALMNGRLRGFSLGRLMHFLNALGHDVDIVVKRKPRNREQGETHVVL